MQLCSKGAVTIYDMGSVHLVSAFHPPISLLITVLLASPTHSTTTMDAVKNLADKVTGNGDAQQAGVTNSAAVSFPRTCP